MRFELIDQVLERSPERVVAIKNVTSAEEYLADHFPGFPVLPGVMMLETLAQAGRALVAGRNDGGPDAPLVVGEVRNIRYSNMVRPGESLKVEVTLRKRDEKGYEFEGVGSVGDKVAVQGRFRLTPLSPPWK
ncbi:MAG: beta-hydroxyacyl-ACP dehydratase [Planctomycetes bacterium]|nr:beta-hydroxyacyl-ACP dehydratase [Planctomycetota bacterium]